jgi:hypothetical protein
LINSSKGFLFTIKRIPSIINKHKEIVLILFLSFMMRYFLLDWNSYWLDELFSVYDRGIRLGSALEVLRYHQDIGSIKPLYEFLLFNWMSLFGHSEVATRLLSTIYVTLSILFLYLFTLRIFRRRIAIASTIFYSVSYMAIYYSLESRYYGQILFLSTLSSYLLVLYLHSLGQDYCWKRLLINSYFFLLTLSNVALMLSHNFTFLFIFTQGIFFYFYFLYQNNKERFFLNTFKVLVAYLVQLAVMFAVWGFAIIQTIFAFSGTSVTIDSNAISSAQLFFRSPLELFVGNIMNPNIYLPESVLYAIYFVMANRYLTMVAFIMILLFFTYIAARYAELIPWRDIKKNLFPRKTFIFYIIFMVFLPTIFTYCLYSFFQFDRFFERYLIYCVPPLMILVAFTFEQVIILLDRMLRRLSRVSFIRSYLRYTVIYTIILSMVFIVPGGYRAASSRKADWRGITNHIVQQIHRDTVHSFIVYETTYTDDRNYTLMDYYFERYSDEVRVFDTIQRSVEASLEEGEEFIPQFLEQESRRSIDRHDFLIVSFHDLSVSFFPRTIEFLSEEFDFYCSYLDNQERGYMIFRIHPPQ